MCTTASSTTDTLDPMVIVSAESEANFDKTKHSDYLSYGHVNYTTGVRSQSVSVYIQ